MIFLIIFITLLTKDSLCTKNELISIKDRKQKFNYNKYTTEFLKDLILMDSSFYLKIGDLKNKREFALAAVMAKAENYSLIPEVWRDDEEIAWFGSLSPDFLENASEIIKNNRKMFINHAQYHKNIRTIPDALRSDREVLEMAVKSNGSLIRFASDELRSDKKLCLQSIEGSSLAYRYLGNDLKKDPDIIKAELSNHPNNIFYVDEKLIDRELLLETVSHNDFDINNLSMQQRSDKEVILSLNYFYLSSLPEITRNNKEVILKAIQRSHGEFSEHYLINEENKKDRDICLMILNKNGMLPYPLDISLYRDKEILIKTLSHQIDLYFKLDDDLKNTPGIYLATIRGCDKSNILKVFRATNELKKNKNIILETAKVNKKVYRYMTRDMLSDNDIMERAEKYVQDKMSRHHKIFKHTKIRKLTIG